METKTYRDRLVQNIEALGIAYSQMIDILKEEIDLEKITDDKWKNIADGKGKAQEVADKLLLQLKHKEEELHAIDNPDEEETETTITTVKKIKEKSSLNQHLK
jgi:hypothetical protein